MSELLTNPEQSRHMAQLEESTRLLEVDGILPNGIDRYSMYGEQLVDPVTGIRSGSREYQELPEYQQVAIDLRIQKYAVIQVAFHRYKDLSEDELSDEQSLEAKYAQSRLLLAELADETYRRMEANNVRVLFEDPFTGDPLPPDSLKVYRYYLIGESGILDGYRNGAAQAECRDFYRQFRTVLTPENSTIKFLHNLSQNRLDVSELFTDTLHTMQGSIVTEMQFLIEATRQSTGVLKNANKALSRYAQPNRILSDAEIIPVIPAVVRAYIRYYTQQGYVLPYEEHEVQDSRIADAIVMVRACRDTIAQVDSGVREVEQNRLERIDRYLDWKREKTLQKQNRGQQAFTPIYRPKAVVYEGDTVGHRLLLTRLGLPATDVLRRIELASRKPVYDDAPEEKALYAPVVVQQTLERMQTLEAERPGITKALYERFGIVNYMRCPLNIWIDQFDLMDEPDIPFGAGIFGVEDYNGAFLGKEAVWDRFYQSLKKGGQHMRVLEATGKHDLARRLFALRMHYRPLASWGVLNAHGSKNGFMLSSGKDGRVTTTDITTVDGKSVLRCFHPEASIAFISCSTGQFEGIVNAVAWELDGELTGPQDDTNVAWMQWEDNKLYIGYQSGFKRQYKKRRMIY